MSQEQETHLPFSLEEAIEVADDFQDLVDTEITLYEDKTYLIDRVFVCPFDIKLIPAFLDDAEKSGDYQAALSACNVTEYDVMFSARELPDKRKSAHIDIRTFANARGIKYRFPR